MFSAKSSVGLKAPLLADSVVLSTRSHRHILPLRGWNWRATFVFLETCEPVLSLFSGKGFVNPFSNPSTLYPC